MISALRPVAGKVNDVIGNYPNGAFNFGLFFNKWFYVISGKAHNNKQTEWCCPLQDESRLKGTTDEPNVHLDNLEISIGLFNASKTYKRERIQIQNNGKPKSTLQNENIKSSWERNQIAKLLAHHHSKLETGCNAFEKTGFRYKKFTFPLRSSLVIGLGNGHPTEKSFRFDWTLGIPMIPSSSIKGVVRLAWLVNELNSLDIDDARSYWFNASNNILDETTQQIFGCGEAKNKGLKQTARCGNVIFLDAFPVQLPRLKTEIMNCHYKDYLMGDGSRGPTEDQQPNPQKFWAVDRFIDGDKPLEFVFRVLVDQKIADQPDSFQKLENAFFKALEKHGIGAKTSIGHGRFDVDEYSKKDANLLNNISRNDNASEQQNDAAISSIVETKEYWPSANLSWSPGNSTITAVFQGKKAQATGKNLVPTTLNDRLFIKKKPVTACVEVTTIGNKYVITEISEISKLA
jgi:CRISPR-associated protein Cmr6